MKYGPRINAKIEELLGEQSARRVLAGKLKTRQDVELAAALRAFMQTQSLLFAPIQGTA